MHLIGHEEEPIAEFIGDCLSCERVTKLGAMVTQELIRRRDGAVEGIFVADVLRKDIGDKEAKPCTMTGSTTRDAAVEVTTSSVQIHKPRSAANLARIDKGLCHPVPDVICCLDGLPASTKKVQLSNMLRHFIEGLLGSVRVALGQERCWCRECR